MRTIRLTFLIGFGLFLLIAKYALEPQEGAPKSRVVQDSSWNAPASPPAVPKKVLHVLEIVRDTGRAPEGYVGGRVFQNREGRLPSDGEYREFDVDPHHGGRNAERLIVEWRTKKAWYTADHYQTFTPLP